MHKRRLFSAQKQYIHNLFDCDNRCRFLAIFYQTAKKRDPVYLKVTTLRQNGSQALNL